MNVVKEHREEGLWKKSFWVIERFLMKGGDKSASDISQNRLLPATLVSAFHHGDVSTSQMAEKILRHLNKMPNTTTNFTIKTMASFSMEDFVGNGVLKKLLPVLLEEGWDDVPTLKIMNAEDMDVIKMTQQQKDALEIRSYLHDHALMQYADKLEASAKGLPELLNLSSMDLSSQFGMKRGHLARFMDRTSACTSTDPLPPSYSMPARKQRAILSRSSSIFRMSMCLSTPER
ncbi:hypothetical protein RJ639_036962 [Escallonia herrerae]|uniref:Uncharacterized protein n=1 Tax=Escallonia herrerae TaxID=1293975 RepID=A0AA88WVW9_9ASTE|nr:hypothetical protein RJ639_036962 [Escallonia herrerae]